MMSRERPFRKAQDKRWDTCTPFGPGASRGETAWRTPAPDAGAGELQVSSLAWR